MIINKIAIFTPLPPSRTGIADYAAEIGSELEKYVEVVYVVSNDAEESTYIPTNGIVMKEHNFLSSEEASMLPRIYQMGNNLHHEFILKQVMEVPGIVVLHDYSMHHLFVELTLARDDPKSYKEIMKYNYGEQGKIIADNRSQGIFNEIYQFIFPLNQTVIDASKSILVHSYESFYRAKEQANSDTKVFKISFPYKNEENNFLSTDTQEVKNKLNIPLDKIILASFGFVTSPKQIGFTLKAISEIKEDLPDFLFYIVGEVSNSVPLEALISEYNLEENVKILGYVDFEHLHLYMQASDIVINLRYPSAGETSAALYRAMGMGKCCLVFDYSSFSDLPDDTLIKIKLDTHDTVAMKKKLEYFTNNTDEIRIIEKKAKQYISKKHSLSVSANQYIEAIQSTFSKKMADI